MQTLLHWGRVKCTAEFSVISINVIGLGKVFVLEAAREEDVSLLAGLDDAATSVAVIDENATVLEASSHFCFVGEMVKILLQTIDNEVPVKTILSIGGISKRVSIIRLKIKPASFLVLCASLKAELKADDLKCEEELFRFTLKLLLRHFTCKMDKNGRSCNVLKDLGEIIGSLSSSILRSHFHELAD